MERHPQTYPHELWIKKNSQRGHVFDDQSSQEVKDSHATVALATKRVIQAREPAGFRLT
jgi:hypothetical protein